VVGVHEPSNQNAALGEWWRCMGRSIGKQREGIGRLGEGGGMNRPIREQDWYPLARPGDLQMLGAEHRPANGNAGGRGRYEPANQGAGLVPASETR